MSATPVKILVPGNHLMVGLLGERDELLRLIEEAFPDVRIVARGNEISIEGDDAERVGRLFDELVVLLEQGQRLDASDISRTIVMVKDDISPAEVLTTEVLRSARGRTVRPKTAGQKRYTDAIAHNVVTFGIGPAGTGKSYLAVALGVQALQAHEVDRIILTRPGGGGRRASRASCPATSWPRSTPTCGPSTTPSTTCSGPRGPSGCSSGAPSRSPPWPSCGAAPSTAASSSSTRPRTPRRSR